MAQRMVCFLHPEQHATFFLHMARGCSATLYLRQVLQAQFWDPERPGPTLGVTEQQRSRSRKTNSSNSEPVVRVMAVNVGT